MKLFLAITFVGLSSLRAQDGTSLHARELFYTPVPQSSAQPAAQPPAKPVEKAPAPKAPSVAKSQPVHTVTVAVSPTPLGIRYSVLKRNPEGKFEEVDSDTNFRSGDRIRVKVDSNNSGYLYIVAQGSSGAWQLLFPSAEVAGGSNLIQRGESRVIPPGDRGQWAFDDRGGVEKLFVVLTRQPEADLDKLIYSFGGAQSDGATARTLVAKASVSDDVISRLRQQVSARDLVFEKVDNEADGKIEKAAYVVNPSAAPDARLVVDVSLKHK